MGVGEEKTEGKANKSITMKQQQWWDLFAKSADMFPSSSSALKKTWTEFRRRLRLKNSIKVIKPSLMSTSLSSDTFDKFSYF